MTSLANASARIMLLVRNATNARPNILTWKPATQKGASHVSAMVMELHVLLELVLAKILLKAVSKMA